MKKIIPAVLLIALSSTPLSAVELDAGVALTHTVYATGLGTVVYYSSDRYALTGETLSEVTTSSVSFHISALTGSYYSFDYSEASASNTLGAKIIYGSSIDPIALADVTATITIELIGGGTLELESSSILVQYTADSYACFYATSTLTQDIDFSGFTITFSGLDPDLLPDSTLTLSEESYISGSSSGITSRANILNVIPEPSTYAALFGSLAFGSTLLLRRKSPIARAASAKTTSRLKNGRIFG